MSHRNLSLRTVSADAACGPRIAQATFCPCLLPVVSGMLLTDVKGGVLQDMDWSKRTVDQS